MDDEDDDVESCSGTMNTVCYGCWGMIKQVCKCKPARYTCHCAEPKPYCADTTKVEDLK